MVRGRSRLTSLAVCAVVAACTIAIQAPVAGAVEFEFEGAFGPDGSNLSGFAAPGSVAVDHEEDVAYVLDREADALFKFDLEGNPVAFGGSSPNLSGNELSGLSIGGGLGSRQVAVNSETHTIYLTGGFDLGSEKSTALQAFESDGDPALFTSGPGAGTNEITGFPGLGGVAVDVNGSIYVSGTEADEFGVLANDISIYSGTGALILASVDGGLLSPKNLSVDSSGAVYVLRNFVEVVRYTPSEFPVTPATTYTVSPELIDPNPSRSLAVDPLTDRLYVVESFQEEGTPIARVAVFDKEGVFEGTFAGPGEVGELERPDGIAVANVGEFGGDGDIAQPFVAQNPEGGLNQVKIFREMLTISAPSVEVTTAADVTGDSARLRAKINPNNRQTNYWFEYGTQDCESGPCTKVPLEGGSVGNGRIGVGVADLITGLAAQTVYHFRVVAENELGTTVGPSKTFITQGLDLGFALGDARVWEMVSPPQKFGGTLFVDDRTVIRAAESGDKLVYASRGPIVEGPVSNRLSDPATVLAKRGGNGQWNSEDLTPPHTEATRVDGTSPFKVFTPDLLRAEMEPTDNTPLSPEATEQTPYLWADGNPLQFTPMVTPSNVPFGTKFGPKAEPGKSNDPIRLEGASRDLHHVVLRSDEVPLVEGAEPGSIYLWSGGELAAVSEMPDTEGGETVRGMLGSGQGSVRGAVSNDGSRVFWAPGQGYNAAGISLPALYLRDTVAGESVRLDTVQPGGSGAGAPIPAFNGASLDGRVVFFTDSQQLTEDASPAGRDLYRCEIGSIEGSLGCIELTDISAPLDGSGESAGVLDQVSAISEDGTRLYFVARGVLDGAPNEEGDDAQSGVPNLYYWEEDAGVRFIATLAAGDNLVWGGAPLQGYSDRISAAASPSGRYLAFTSERSLTGYENRTSSGQANSEVFVYDAELGDLTCASCNPTGAAAVGERIPANVKILPHDPAKLWVNRWVAATLPEAGLTELVGRSLYRPRTALDNGRVFFNSVDPLVPVDSNRKWDIYQYQPVGVGTCAANTGTASVSRSGNGCVALLSSGTAAGDSGFLDASPSGNDVFFLTKGRLSVLDQDDELDVYDARVNGVSAVLSPPQTCAGEACRPAFGPPPSSTPASESFHGRGSNFECRRNKQAKARRGARHSGRAACRHKKHRKHQRKRAAKKQQQRSGNGGRGGR
jgi:hypothetical protein